MNKGSKNESEIIENKKENFQKQLQERRNWIENKISHLRF